MRRVGISGICGVGQPLQVQAGLSDSEIQVMCGQQPVALAADVADLQNHIPGDFPLDIKVILDGILRALMRLQLPEQDDGTKD